MTPGPYTVTVTKSRQLGDGKSSAHEVVSRLWGELPDDERIRIDPVYMQPRVLAVYNARFGTAAQEARHR